MRMRNPAARMRNYATSMRNSAARMRDSVTRARNTEVQSNLTSEILLDSTQGLTLNVNSTPYSCFTPYYVSIHTPVTTFSESQGGVTPLNLDAEATRAKTRFWNRIAETFYQLHERTYHLYTASAYMASPDEELALLEAVRVVNVDGQRALREFMIFLRNTRDEGELLMSRCAREHMEQLQEFDRFCQRREVLVNTMKWQLWSLAQLAEPRSESAEAYGLQTNELAWKHPEEYSESDQG